MPASPAQSLFCFFVPPASLLSFEVPSGSKMGSGSFKGSVPSGRRAVGDFSLEGEEEPECSAGLQLLHTLHTLSSVSKPAREFPGLS